MHSSVAHTQYPEASAVEERSKRVAVELGDISPKTLSPRCCSRERRQTTDLFGRN